jgi:hypothetical protein
MEKVRLKAKRNFSIDVFYSNSILRIGKVNLPEETENGFENEKTVAVFDIESNGKELLFGFYDGNEYKYKIIKNAGDAEEVIEWLLNVEISYFYGDYDLPVTLSPYLVMGNNSRLRKKNLGDNIYVLGNGYTIEKLKNLYKIKTVNKESIAINLLTFYSGSLYDSYTSFYNIIKETFGDRAFNEKTLKEWKEDKEKRKDFENVRMDNPELIKYNRLDVIATYQLALILDKIFPMKVRLTLPATAISYILEKTKSDYVYYYLKNKKYYGLPNIPIVINVLKQLYKGGLFDSNELGVFQKVYKYDINSMYPFMMTWIPELELVRVTDNPKSFTIDTPLLDGTWFNEDAKYLRIYHICFKDNPKFIASKVNHMLMRVQESCTSVFDFEIWKDQDVVINNFELKGMIEFKITKKRIFKNVIEEIYNKRLALKKQKNPFEKVYKLIMNSSYGKFGERILTTNSRFKNVIYASMITALGRTYIQSADPNSIAYLTDSVFTFKPLKSSLVGDSLGQFKKEGEGKLYIIGNGLYVLDDSEEKMIKYRGFKFESEKDAEKTIKYIAEELTKGRIVRVKIPTSIMIKNIYTLRVLDADEVKIGTLGVQEKILSPLNAKQRYVYHNGVWIGQMFKNEEEAKEYKKELKKTLDSIEPIDLKTVIESYK